MNDNLIERAEKLLVGITPGPWEAVMCGSCEDLHANGVWSIGKEVDVLRDEVNLTQPDAEFIAAAPEITRDLLAEVKRLTPRVIETMTELRALPEGTVVREGGDVPFIYESYWDATWDELRWLYPGDDDPQRNIELPVTVLHIPEGGDL